MYGNVKSDIMHKHQLADMHTNYIYKLKAFKAIIYFKSINTTSRSNLTKALEYSYFKRLYNVFYNWKILNTSITRKKSNLSQIYDRYLRLHALRKHGSPDSKFAAFFV